jgi:hypothetical protein
MHPRLLPYILVETDLTLATVLYRTLADEAIACQQTDRRMHEESSCRVNERVECTDCSADDAEDSKQCRECKNLP